MAPDANPAPGDPPQAGSSDDDLWSDEARLAEHAGRLADAVERVVPGWIERIVVERLRQWSGHVSAEVAAEAVTAGEAARDELMPRLRDLLATDVEAQRENPLSLLRDSTRHASAVLAGHDVPAMPRDQFSRQSFPTDVYGLVPATWADIHPDLHEPGITWGAAKAFVFKARRRRDGFT